MQQVELIAHPSRPPVAEISMRFSWQVRHGWLMMRWRIDGGEGLVVPGFAGSRREDGLWQTTCFELFVLHGKGRAYSEFNFSPSERWAAYDFDGYRAGMTERPMAVAPVCTWRKGSAFSLFDVAIRLADLPTRPGLLGPTAVLEENDGTRSCWAIDHGAREPDFHDPACFAAELGPTDSA